MLRRGRLITFFGMLFRPAHLLFFFALSGWAHQRLCEKSSAVATGFSIADRYWHELYRLQQSSRVTETPIVTQSFFDSGHPDIIDVRGIPADAAFIRAGTRVYRHYSTPAICKKLREELQLRSGANSYVQNSPGLYRKLFSDLHGIFLTLPAQRAQNVGVAAAAHDFVDIVLDADTPLIELEAGKIFLIPLPPRHFEWIENALAPIFEEEISEEEKLSRARSQASLGESAYRSYSRARHFFESLATPEERQERLNLKIEFALAD